MQQVEHHYELARHLGLTEWIRIYKPDQYFKDIVEEFLTDPTEKIQEAKASQIAPASGLKQD